MKMLDPNNDPRTVNTPKTTLNEDGSWIMDVLSAP